MRVQRLAVVLYACAALAEPARATTFSLDWQGLPTVDPMTGFAADCSGETQAPDCPGRAAALEADLIEHLAALSDEDDAETVALFERTLVFPSPQVQEISLTYFATRSTPPDGLWAQARVFFFGRDPAVGVPAAELLAQSSDDADIALSQRYGEGRTDQSHGGTFPAGAGPDDTWAAGIAHDLALEALVGFKETDRFPGAERLLMNDRVLPDFFVPDAGEEIVVTGFVTRASVADVIAHFTALFGRAPFPPTTESNARQQAISDEMLALQDRLAEGDQAAIERFTALSEELTALSGATTIALRLGFDALELSDHVFWSDIESDTAFDTSVRRSVAVGTDALVGQTVIRHFAGAAGPRGAEGEGEGEGGPTDSSDSDDDVGCGCTLNGGGQPPAFPLVAVAALLASLWRRRRTLNA